MQMPDLDGLNLAVRLHALPGAAQLPLILLSSAEGHHDRGDARWLHSPRASSEARQISPVARRAAHRPRPAARGRQPGGASGRDRNSAEEFPLRILLAEDNIVNQKVAVRFLALMGYRCRRGEQRPRGGGSAGAPGVRCRVDGRADAGDERLRRPPRRSAGTRRRRTAADHRADCARQRAGIARSACARAWTTI